ncbi:MAG: glutamine amidotransferase class-I family protein [Rhizobacter sp.]|nr:glutamine amidotransferase class-I family protein [Rhizobacter sp.]
MKHAIAIRHVDFEDLGTLKRSLTENQYSIEYVDASVEDLTSAHIEAADLLLVLGGPISAYQDRDYPFILEELKLIERRMRLGKPLLGICLGAQLIARACGARVYPGPVGEIGWGPVALTPAGKRSALAGLAQGQSVLHWHHDTFDLPPGATHLASTPLCEQQAFEIGPRLLALQFHLETSARDLERWLVGHAGELAREGIRPQSLRDGANRGSSAGTGVIGRWLADIDRP